MTLVLYTTILRCKILFTPGWLMWHRSSPAHRATAAAVTAKLCTLDWTGSAREKSRQCLHLQGLYQDKPPLPFIPGSEVSGIVTEVGAKVKSVKQGDHVCPFPVSHDQTHST